LCVVNTRNLSWLLVKRTSTIGSDTFLNNVSLTITYEGDTYNNNTDTLENIGFKTAVTSLSDTGLDPYRIKLKITVDEFFESPELNITNISVVDHVSYISDAWILFVVFRIMQLMDSGKPNESPDDIHTLSATHEKFLEFASEYSKLPTKHKSRLLSKL